MCWDVKLSCAEGKQAVARTCVDVEAGQTVDVTLRESDFRGFDGCEPPVTSNLLNLEVKAD